MGCNSALEDLTPAGVQLDTTIDTLGYFYSGSLPWEYADPLYRNVVRRALGHVWKNGKWVISPGRAPNLPTSPVWTSNLWKLFYEYPPATFRAQMRVSKNLADRVVHGVVAAGWFRDNECSNQLYRTASAVTLPAPELEASAEGLTLSA